MKTYIRVSLILIFTLYSLQGDTQAGKQVTKPAVDSLISEIKSLIKYESSTAIIFGKLESYEWNVRFAHWDSIYKSKGGKITKYPDSPNVKMNFCDSISPYEKIFFNRLINIKKETTDDILVNLSNHSTPEVAVYCFMLLCSDDNPKSKAILDYYLSSETEIWVEECGRRTKQKVRDFMLARLLSCLFYDGRKPMISEKELKTYYSKIGKEYPFRTE